ncbi:MAG: YqeG family HAD IIIA-type phosphatase, partial [Cyanobacteria bacterium REEB65]|nr:YqeG family HAD IIIA-type phosphatase [Cyanobacteria bacterium REEB65]
MIRSFLPDQTVDAIVDLDPQRLAAEGIRGLILDLDDTLVCQFDAEPADLVCSWIAVAKEHLKVVIVSNNRRHRRISLIAQRLSLPFIHRAFKPLLPGLRRALRMLELPADQVAVVGDQIFTDILGGRWLGARTILVSPLSQTETKWYRHLMRRTERAVLRQAQDRRAAPGERDRSSRSPDSQATGYKARVMPSSHLRLAGLEQPDFEAAARLFRQAPPPEYGIILGSGLSILEDLQDRCDVPYRDLPGFPLSTVEGHRGVLSVGTIANGARVAIARGRFHLYEGLPADSASYLVRLFKALGARSVILTNAAGGLHADWHPGDLMLLTDQLNLTFRSTASPQSVRPARPLYDPDWRAEALAIAQRESLLLRQGIYVGLLGPSYETAAEIRFLSDVADAVGMSTVLEAASGCGEGLRILGISCITNVAVTSVGLAETSHEEV